MAALATLVVGICLQAIFCAIKFAFGDDVVSLFLVVEYVLMMKLIKFESLRESVKVKVDVTVPTKQKVLPLVYSKTVWMMCEALGIEASLASFEEARVEKMRFKTIKNLKYQLLILKRFGCFAKLLGLKAELA
ncbi:hypothetical protein CEXT_699641 [Caerostris extrusa]|uniref:Uncharacterized protein n=1 Tax=Caerostris extrusa TaxID=172846 RepID=A0AAV4T986_CAEEX|nr:hypothetical protein CEXT_699641 [Caerostris extrusa]